MRVEVITVWYNEAFLAPFFLRHYSWADKITLLYDRDTTDNTLDIAQSYPNVQVKPFRFPDMLDEGIKQLQVNNAYAASECDWTVLVDADEFVFRMEEGEPVADIRPLLTGRSSADASGVPDAPDIPDIIEVDFFDVFRNRVDADLDPNLPVVPQRRYGKVGIGKPCVARGGHGGLLWKIGCHSVVEPLPPGLRQGPHGLAWAHWFCADAGFVIPRRLRDRKNRQSKANIERGMDSHNHTVTRAQLEAMFAEHVDDPKLF